MPRPAGNVSELGVVARIGFALVGEVGGDRHLADRRRVVIGREGADRDARHRGDAAAALSCSRRAAGSVTGRRQAKLRQT